MDTFTVEGWEYRWCYTSHSLIDPPEGTVQRYPWRQTLQHARNDQGSAMTEMAPPGWFERRPVGSAKVHEPETAPR